MQKLNEQIWNENEKLHQKSFNFGDKVDEAVQRELLQMSNEIKQKNELIEKVLASDNCGENIK